MYSSRRGLGSTASPQVQSIAQAIATAEGGLTPGTFPYRTNNPCDVFVGGSTAGYSSMDAGWQACYNQINAILGNTSTAGYNSGMPIQQIAQIYVCGPNAPSGPCPGGDPSIWANNVANVLGLSPSDPLTAVGGSVAESVPDSSTVTQTPTSADSGVFDLSSWFPSVDSGGSGVQFVDDSGNLTGLAWGLIAATGVGLVLLVS